jgi:hypothetical protein
METKLRKWYDKKWLPRILALCLLVLSAISFYFYNNYNRLLAEALINSFNSSIASDVYELKFKDLDVNFLSGSIKVNDVQIIPREKPLKTYPYINSTFRMNTKKLILSKVELLALLKQNVLKLERVIVAEPEIELVISDEVPVFIPFSEAPKDTVTTQSGNNKRIIAFSLKKFDLINASFHVTNSAKGRDLDVKGVGLSFRDLLMDQQPGMDLISYSNLNFSIGEMAGSLQSDKLKHIYLRDYQLIVDSMKVQKSQDTVNYKFQDVMLGLNALDIQTADSVYHLALNSFELWYKSKSIVIKDLIFEPNISDAEIQKKFKFQHTQFSGRIASLNISGLDFDSLFHHKKLFIDEITLDSVTAHIFKDKTKPMDLKKFPVYLGQTIREIKLPLHIKHLTAGKVNLVNKELKVDATYATANINRGTLHVENISNIDTQKELSIQLNAFLEHKVPFAVKLGFDYRKPRFSMEGSFEKFQLSDLNHLITAYTPAKISSGTVNGIDFSGIAYEKKSIGTMKFLYHDLKIDLELREKAKWKSSILAFAANTIVASSNPASPNLPPKIVKFEVDRDMNKSFVNITIKSALAGLKETAMMSKENRKIYNEMKKKAKAAKATNNR